MAAAFRMIPSINRILGTLQNFKFYGVSVDKLYDQLDEFKHKKDLGDSKKISFTKKINLEEISFSYKEKLILKNVSLEIPKGKTIGIIGESGSGKSTLVDLINGLLQPKKGKIKVDGKEISEYLKSWQKSIGYVGQDIFLIDDSIKANITFGVNFDKIINSRVLEVVNAAQLSSLIEELEFGIETRVGERGVQLSGGQKQRIGIARALYNNPTVLIFDEATASLDNDTEKQVMNSIYDLKKEKTMIIISHRISTLKNCDYVYEIKNGKINLKN